MRAQRRSRDVFVHVFQEGRLLLSRSDERLADLMERTVREYLDAAPLLRQATIEAYGA